MHYNVIIIGGGPGGIFSAYELTKDRSDLRVAVFEAGHSLEKRHCPIDGDKVKTCIGCKTCAIMSGFGGAGAFSDGKYNITNDFGGTLHEYIGKKQALDLMHYVDEINMAYGGEGTKLYSTAGTKFKKLCIQNKLNLLDASVRHLGTDVNLVVLSNLYDLLKDKVDFYFDSPVTTIAREGEGYRVTVGETDYTCDKCIVSVGRVGSKWMEGVCQELKIPTKSNRGDIGVRVEIPAVVFSHLTDELYESKIVYRTEKFEDNVRTFCMNPASPSTRTRPASPRPTATAMRISLSRPRTRTSRFSLPSTSPSRSRIPTATASPSRACPTCSAAASLSSASAISYADAAARSSASKKASSRRRSRRPPVICALCCPSAIWTASTRCTTRSTRSRRAPQMTIRSSTAWRSSSTTWRSRSTSTLKRRTRGSMSSATAAVLRIRCRTHRRAVFMLPERFWKRFNKTICKLFRAGAGGFPAPRRSA